MSFTDKILNQRISDILLYEDRRNHERTVNKVRVQYALTHYEAVLKEARES